MTPYPVYMPDGRIAPLLLTAEETCAFLRLEIPEGSDGRVTLEHYRRQCGLRATMFGRRVMFRLADVIEFIGRHAEEVRR